MDGSDGIIAACLIPASLALGFMAEGWVAASAFALAAALAGFSVLNAPILSERGRIFSGDVGSLGLLVEEVVLDPASAVADDVPPALRDRFGGARIPFQSE